MLLILKPIINLFSISIRLLPAFYFLSLGVASIAELITEQTLDIYAVTFRPFVYSLLMLCLLWILSSDKLVWFNKYFWYWVRGDRPYQVIYLWLSLIVGVFGITCLASGLVTVLINSDSPLSMFNIREDIFYSAAAAFLISPIFITSHLQLKGGR
jgi:hypothetical protein